MRAPSKKLTELLLQLQLSDANELLACERHVRRLCHDLPDFDSVWLDALVQRRLLTPWQAETLQSTQSPQLKVGEYNLRQPLGHRSFTGTDPSRHRHVVLRRIPTETVFDKLQDVLQALRTLASRCPAALLLPQQLISSSAANTVREAWLVSPLVPGWSADELLIRGGRFPWQAVAELGRDLLTALAWLESIRLLHGDIVLRHVRLTPGGRVVLTDPFLRRLLQPRLLMSESLTLRDCEGIAPELVGSGRLADSRSELYALGCLLWHLLSSRPPVLTADPISRLMKQKEQDIADIRGPVPDCPEWMARLLLSMTRRSPELRPSGADEVLQQWKKHTPLGHRHLKRIAGQMPDRHVPRIPPRRANARSGSVLSWRFTGLTAALLIVLVFSSARYGVLPKTLRMGPPSSWINAIGQSERQPLPTENASNSHRADTADPSGIDRTGANAEMSILPLPAADNDGLIILQPGRRYAASDRQHPRTLILLNAEPSVDTDRSSPMPDLSIGRHGNPVSSAPVVIVEQGRRWHLQAPQVSLRDITVRSVSTTEDSGTDLAARASGMLYVDASEFSLDHCVVEQQPQHGISGLRSQPGAATSESCCIWNSPTSAPSTMIVRDTVIAGRGYGIRLLRPGDTIMLDNVLLVTGGSAVRCDFPLASDQRLQMELQQVTVHGGPAVLDLVIRHDDIKQLSAVVRGGESVLTADRALIRLAGPAHWPLNGFRAEFLLPQQGNGIIVPPGIEWAVFFDPQLKSLIRVPADQLQADSLLIAQPIFGALEPAGAVEAHLTELLQQQQVLQYQLLDFEGPKLNSTMPGIRPDRLPPW